MLKLPLIDVLTNEPVEDAWIEVGLKDANKDGLSLSNITSPANSSLASKSSLISPANSKAMLMSPSNISLKSPSEASLANSQTAEDLEAFELKKNELMK